VGKWGSGGWHRVDGAAAIGQSEGTREVAVGRSAVLGRNFLCVCGAQVCRNNSCAAAHRGVPLVSDIVVCPDKYRRASKLKPLPPPLHIAPGHFIACARVDRLDESEDYFHKAVQIQELVTGPEHPHLAFMFNSLAGVLTASGKFQEAKAQSDKALQIFNAVSAPPRSG